MRRARIRKLPQPLDARPGSLHQARSLLASVQKSPAVEIAKGLTQRGLESVGAHLVATQDSKKREPGMQADGEHLIGLLGHRNLGFEHSGGTLIDR